MLGRECRHLAAEIVKVREANAAMRELLSSEYRARNLFLGSAFSTLAMSGALALHVLRGVTVIDPFLAGVLLAVSLGFLGLAVLRARGEKGAGR